MSTVARLLPRWSIETRLQIVIFFTGLGLALLVGELVAFRFAGEYWEYSVIAQSLIRGEGGAYPYLGITYYFFGPTLYPRLLAVVAELTHGNQNAIVWLHVVIFAATGPLVFKIARKFLEPGFAFAAGMLAICHPGNLIYTAKLHPHTLDVFLVAAAFLLICRFTLRLSPATGVAAGVTLGLAGLSRGTIGTFAVVWALWFLYAHREKLLLGAVRVATPALLAFMTVSPVLLGGYLHYGQFVPLRTDTGANFWVGNNAQASGTLVTVDPVPRIVIDLLPRSLASRLPELNELEQNSALKAAAIEWMAGHPREAAGLLLRKLSYFWWFAPSTGLTYPGTWTQSYALYYSLVLVMAGFGVFWMYRERGARHHRLLVMFMLLFSSYSVTQAMFYVEGRHRWEIEPLLLIMSVVGIARTLGLNPIRCSETSPVQLQVVH